MDTATHDLTHDGASHAGQSHGASDKQYIQIAVVLAIITGLEVYASYADWLGAAFLPVLLVMMVIKFVMVVLYFMHLKFDSKWFGFLFWSGFGLAIAVYVAALACFHFFATSS
jgi:cytochrome c oxidase subunit 4